MNLKRKGSKFCVMCQEVHFTEKFLDGTLKHANKTAERGRPSPSKVRSNFCQHHCTRVC